jgi:hypothetical protein
VATAVPAAFADDDPTVTTCSTQQAHVDRAKKAQVQVAHATARLGTCLASLPT